MNQRILKLFTKACYHGDYEPENVPNEVVEKFAELIVTECMKLNSKDLSITAIERLLPLYEEHFGIEL